jgi:poly(3-hydroxybutyrate) depolymerase
MSRTLRLLAAAAAFSFGLAHAAVPLPRYNVDRAQTTVSGLSSGGFMANQLGWAHSALFRGVGVFRPAAPSCAPA